MTEDFKENDIRPDRLKAAQEASIQADISWLEERSAEFVDMPCPACGVDRSVKEFYKKPHSYVSCQECGSLYVNPRPSEELLAGFYKQSSNYDYWNKYIFPASEAIRREKIFLPRVERLTEVWKKYGYSGGTLLEVGAGFGIFCEELSRIGLFKRIIGVEPTPSLAQTCRDKNIEILEKPFEDVLLDDNSIDIVAAFEVIEHLFRPADFLRKCSSILKKNGLIVVTCPNWSGFDLQVLQSSSDTVDHEHLNYFTPHSISKLFESFGFKVVELFTPGKLDAELVRKKVLEGQFDLSDNRFLSQILLTEWDRLGAAFQTFLSDQGLSSHLWLVAKLDK